MLLKILKFDLWIQFIFWKIVKYNFCTFIMYNLKLWLINVKINDWKYFYAYVEQRDWKQRSKTWTTQNCKIDNNQYNIFEKNDFSDSIQRF